MLRGLRGRSRARWRSRDEIALAPTQEFAAPILGRVGPVTAEMIEEDPDRYQVGDIAGLRGLQARYDEQLGGIAGPGRRGGLRDRGHARARPVPGRPVDGEPLELTLDPALQDERRGAARRRRARRARWSRSGPATARSWPPPTARATAGQNFATYGQFAPGSTFKIVSSLALLRAGLTPDSRCRARRRSSVDGKAFKQLLRLPEPAHRRHPAAHRARATRATPRSSAARDELGEGDLADAAASPRPRRRPRPRLPGLLRQRRAAGAETEAAARPDRPGHDPRLADGDGRRDRVRPGGASWSSRGWSTRSTVAATTDAPLTGERGRAAAGDAARRRDRAAAAAAGRRAGTAGASRRPARRSSARRHACRPTPG